MIGTTNEHSHDVDPGKGEARQMLNMKSTVREMNPVNSAVIATTKQQQERNKELMFSNKDDESDWKIAAAAAAAAGKTTVQDSRRTINLYSLTI